MADFWLINGKTALVRKASRRLRKNKTHGDTMAKRRKSHRKAHRRSRKARRASRRFHHNPPPLSLGNAGTAILWGGLAFGASKFASSYIRRYIPSMIPAPDLVAAAASGALVSFAGKYATKSDKARAAWTAGAFLPVAEAAFNMTALGSLLGTQKVVMLAPPAGAQGVQAALSAALSADLSDDGDTVYSGY